jgi:pimeloyl-ACP methyl ester carboxylesterase
VFLDFISYSGGPLPEDLLARMTAPVSILWGAADPWEPCSQGRALFTPLPAVQEFVEMPGLGHCPQVGAPLLCRQRVRF